MQDGSRASKTKRPSRPSGCWSFKSGTLLVLAMALAQQADRWRRPTYIMSAKAAYLEDLASMSQVMSKFVDALLEKVSFLAEIVIESAMEEHCEAGCPAGKAGNLSLTADGQTLRAGDVIRQRRRRAASLVYDPLEFTDEQVFIRALNEPARLLTARQTNEDEPEASSSSCRLFSLSIQMGDLPALEMEPCCVAFAGCYSKCQQEKQVCDLQFQQCLASVCRAKFAPVQDEEQPNGRQLGRRQVTSSSSSRGPPSHGSRLLSDMEPLVDDPYSPTGEQRDNDDYYDELNDPDVRKKRKVEREEPEDPKRMRDKFKACKLASKVLIIGNLAFGCQIYKRSQCLGCSCGSSCPMEK